MATITQFTLTTYSYQRDRIIGDSQVSSDWQHIGALQLHTDTGLTGLGFFFSLFTPLPTVEALTDVFKRTHFQQLQDRHPLTLVHRVTRPRGGKSLDPLFETAIDVALWDLAAKSVELPLYKLLGGEHNKVRAYASPLAYHLDDEQFVTLLERGLALGMTAFKIKVGHPNVAWDIHRLQLARQTVGGDALLMADANEAWSPKEAIRRLYAYREAGITLYWIEDPCLRDDFIGLREVRCAVPFTYVNAGEYLALRGKRQLLDAAGADMLNIHGHYSNGLRAGWMAAEHGIPVSLGNTALELGVHLAVALPEANWIENSFINYNHLVEEPIRFADGYAYAPDRPGHGIVLAANAK